MRRGLAEELPEQHVIWLIGQVIVWISVRVNEEVSLGLMIAHCRGEELPMTLGNVGERLSPI